MLPPQSKFGIIVYPLLFVVITCSMIFTYTVGLGSLARVYLSFWPET